MQSIHVDIVTPQRMVFSESVNEIVVPTRDGQIGVLPKHVSLFTSLTEGEIKIVSGNKETYLAIGGGFMEVTRTKISILVSRAYHADELNEQEIKKAYESAKDAMKRKVTGEDYANAQALLRRSILELKVARRYKQRPMPTINP